MAKKGIIRINNIITKAVILDTEKEQSIGMQALKESPNKYAMVFPKKQKTRMKFHMGSVLFPIDIVFTSNGNIDKIYHDIHPGDKSHFEGEGDMVFEAKGNFCKENNIREGDKVTWVSSY